MKQKIIFIVGPTASGKSALAIDVAKRIGSEIISADSMQIYKNMDVGTAKISKTEMQGVKHHLIDVANAADEFSVAEFTEAAEKVIDGLSKQGKVPVVCGGTGLYVESLLYPLNFSNVVKDAKLRQKLMDEYDVLGGEAMWEKLFRLDEAAANKLHPNDKKRIVRALEILSVSDKKEDADTKEFKCEPLIIVLNDKCRADLYARIDNRVDKMFEQGLCDEIKTLLSLGASFDSQSFQAIGYKEFRQYFLGETTLEEVKNSIKQHSRNYAKRQLTWFKRYKTALWFEPTERDKIMKTVDEFLEK